MLNAFRMRYGHHGLRNKYRAGSCGARCFSRRVPWLRNEQADATFPLGLKTWKPLLARPSSESPGSSSSFVFADDLARKQRGSVITFFSVQCDFISDMGAMFVFLMRLVNCVCMNRCLLVTC